jgi:hypothetical protein
MLRPVLVTTLNHVLQTSSTDAPSGYGEIGEMIASIALADNE